MNDTYTNGAIVARDTQWAIIQTNWCWMECYH